MSINNKKIILNIVSSSNYKQLKATGGTEQRAIRMAPYYKGQNDFLPIYCYSPDGALNKELMDLDYLVEPLNTPSLRQPHVILKYMRIIKKYHVSLVHIQGPYSSDFFAAIAAKLARVPIVVTRPSFVFESGCKWHKKPVLNLISWYTYRLASKIVVVYEKAGQIKELKEIQGKVHVVHNGSGENLLTRQQKNDDIHIGMVAQFTSTKDQLGLTRIFLKIKEQIPNIKLHFFGSGRCLTQVKDYVQEHKISDVEFHGQCSSNTIKQHLINLDIFVLKTYREGLPVSILEAMAAGLPVVASNVGGISEAVLHGETGYVCQNKDEDFIDCLLVLIKDAKLRANQGCRAKERHRQVYSFDNMVREYFKIYKEVSSCVKE